MTFALSYMDDQNTPDIGLAGHLVATRFGQSTDLVNAYDAASSSALNALANFDYTVPMENLDLATEDLDPPPIGDAPAPDRVTEYESQLTPVDFPNIASLRALLELVEITPEQVTLPTLGAVAPTVTIPVTPDDTIPTVPSNAPTASTPVIPTAPNATLPTSPTLEETTVPAVPEIESLTFEAELPTADLTVPEPAFVYSEATYQSDLADALNTKLYNDVVLGGTGLGATVEQAIWDRELSRLDTELDKTHQQTLTDWEAWNCDMPDGVLSGALREVAFESDRIKLDVSRDIAIEQARLAQQNTHFAITSGLVAEKQLMDYTNQVNTRAFEVAKFRVAAVIDAFNLKVNAYNAELEGYKTLAQVFESRIRAELSKLELYKAQIEGAKLHSELQSQKVELYNQQLQGVQTIINLYKAQMEGARLQLEVDKTNVDIFRAQIDAAVAQINGVTAKFNLYQASIAGEAAKVDLYGTQVDAYKTQVEASKIEADVNALVNQAEIESNKDKIAMFASAIERYKSDVQYELGKEDAGVKVYSAQIDEYEAEVKRETDYLKAKVDSYRAQVSEVMSRAELIIKEMDANLRAATAAKEIQMEALKAAANVQTQKVASALTSVSASAQIGFNGSLSDSYSKSAIVNDSFVITDSTDYREAHIYNYSGD